MKTPEAANVVIQWLFVLNSVKHKFSMWVSLKEFKKFNEIKVLKSL